MTSATYTRNHVANHDLFGRIATRVAGFVARSHAQRQLEALDDRLLRDIGISRADIPSMVWRGR